MALPAISIDSYGNTSGTVGGLPALLADPGTPADKLGMVVWREAMRRDPPGQSTDNRWQQAATFKDAVYIAVRTVMTALSGAQAVVSVRRRPQPDGVVAKSQSASAAGAGESDWAPAPSDHPAVRLFEHVNEKDTLADFLSEYVLCRSLFGQAVVYHPLNDAGEPCELWNLRTNYLTALPMSPQYPTGAWQYTMPRPMLWSGQAGMIRVPNELTLVHRDHHPLFPWDGYSPLTAGGKMVDFLNSVLDSRQMSMDNGFTPDILVRMSGATEKQMADFMAKVRERHTGSNRGQRVMAVDAERVDVVPVITPPDKMMYPQGYDQGTAAVLALFGVPAVCAFLAQADYSGFYAAARAWREGDLSGKAKGIGDHWTKHLIRPYWGPDVRVELKLPPLMDPDMRERQNATLLSANAITINETRASYDLPPMDGGDITPAEFTAALQQRQAEQQQQWQMEQMQAQQMQGYDDGTGGGLDDPNAEPAAPGEPQNPSVGAAAEGSLPPRVGKAVRGVREYFATLLDSVCGRVYKSGETDDEPRDDHGRWTTGGGKTRMKTRAELHDWWDHAVIDPLFGEGFEFVHPPAVTREATHGQPAVSGHLIYSRTHAMPHNGKWVDATVEVIDRGHEYGDHRYAVVASTPGATRWRAVRRASLGSGGHDNAAHQVALIHRAALAREFAGLIDPVAVHMPQYVLSDWLRDREYDEQADAIMGRI